MEKDIVIIGGGPGGYVAAIRAAQLGAKVCIVEKGELGGTCLNRGCIPTKALYRNAEILNTLKNINEFGIVVDSYSFSVEEIQNRKDKIVNQLVNGVEQLLKSNNIDVILGTACLKDKNTVSISLKNGELREIITKNIIIATGSIPLIPNIPGIDLPGVFTSENILEFKEVPNKLAIIGGGVIGVEFAGIFNALGSKVTVIEFLPSILAQVDTDLTKRLSVSLKRKGIDMSINTKVISIEKSNEQLIVTADGKKGEIVFTADNVLVSVGRTPMTEGLNIENLGISLNRRAIVVDENYETNIPGIYAIGDVNGISMLAHAATHQGKKVVERIMGYIAPYSSEIIPSCIFAFPEIACVGITENEAKKKGMEYKTSKFLFGANGKALALGEGEGLVKVIATLEDIIIGVHIMGPHASDLIHEGAMAINNNMNVSNIASMIHAHPTLSEAFEEAVLGLKGEAIHMVPAKKR
ncbi:dihydrolipoyl dehydrogenase [Clostridium sp. CM028]|uniref:dihydrolipoyl dehydrogenase n=1 Tax=unclassified Clostridium TaxID=2614128 RepID=UPI001C0E0E1E|nr:MULTISPECIES: dihydrolipoyl dehydrogenase [unclassified Clostridium]MBU3090907.1 dihydrolipoyl dehydrogenase [Clostridium sp. CF011]MBW9144525.1 dihydrolipoyl dehydrogenase [Clostridium sp. CM027]MBW9147945.1 dihydrolipoyl dehydrogenase [Clostridium sp. CM028]UVE40707.1 dihydrolipoyl dehydrogenase [Clostridium sp. CM027]WAG69675.1 dihydrolipoyl dehydrogenase [Clostridium sp. CF011]